MTDNFAETDIEKHGDRSFVKIGEGKEFRVLRPLDRSGIALKIPKEQTAWGNENVSLTKYHEIIADKLREFGFAEYLPSFLREIDDAELGKVIETVDFSDGGKNIVIAMEELDNPSANLIERLLKVPCNPQLINETAMKVRSDLLGSKSSGLVDNAGVKNVVIGADSYHLIVYPDGVVRVILDDLGTVVERNNWDYSRVRENNLNSTLTLLSRINTVAEIFEKAQYLR